MADARGDEHAQRDPAHRAEAQAHGVEESRAHAGLLAPRHRHEDQGQEEHPANPGDGGHDMKPAEGERHRPEHSTAVRHGGRPRPGGGRAEFWTDRTVAWYERANERSAYAAQVLGALGAA